MPARTRRSRLDHHPLRGFVTRVVNINPGTGYVLARVVPNATTAAAAGRRPAVVAVGPMPGLAAGVVLTADGQWEDHPAHGVAFKVDPGAYRVEAPSGAPDGAAEHRLIAAYLASRLIPGVGPKTAGRIVAALGPRLGAVVEGNPADLARVPGVGEATARAIAEAWERDRPVRAAMAELQRRGRPPGLGVAIYRRLGEAGLRRFADDPDAAIAGAEAAERAHARRVAAGRRGSSGTGRGRGRNEPASPDATPGREAPDRCAG